MEKSLPFVQFWAACGFCRRVNSRFHQHSNIKASEVTLTFYYVVTLV